MRTMCIKELEYAGRQIRVGETFDCDPNDVAFLTDVGFIEVERKQSYLTRDMKRRKAA